jgi:hypothetical protein
MASVIERARRFGLRACILALAGVSGWAYAGQGAEVELEEQPPAVLAPAPADARHPVSDLAHDELEPAAILSQPALTWFAVVVLLVLLIQTRPLNFWRNLDAAVLAALCLLLAARNDTGYVAGDRSGLSVQTWALFLLTAGCCYWIVRGLLGLGQRGVGALRSNVSEGAGVVLLAAGFSIALLHIWSVAPGRTSRDVLLGGRHMAATGRLPYGELQGHDSHSPLLYAAQAGILKLVPSGAEGTTGVSAGSGERGAAAGTASADAVPVRLLNTVLLVLTLAPLMWLGHRVSGFATGLALAAVFAVFPGSLECVTHPEVMLPAALVAWTLTLASLPAGGGLLSMLVAVAGGVASPWAWLMVLPLLGYFLRRGWNGVGATAGLLVGFAALLPGLLWLVEPSVPRPDGALAAAGLAPTAQASIDAQDHLVLRPYEVTTAPVRELKSGFWSFLLERETTTVPASQTPYRDVAGEGPVRDRLNAMYRADMRDSPEGDRLWAGLRTVLEATWLPSAAGTDEVDVPASWQAWQERWGSAETWTMARRIMKGLCVLLSLLVMWALLRSSTSWIGQLLGGVTAVLGLALLTSRSGASYGWGWVMPALLGLIACGAGQPRAQLPAPVRVAGEVRPGAPRVTVDN